MKTKTTTVKVKLPEFQTRTTAPNQEVILLLNEIAKRQNEMLRAEERILREVDLIEPMKLLVTNEMGRKVYFAGIYCSNTAFAARLHEKIKTIVGRRIKEVGELDF
jgi:hypothetical protein